MLMRQKVFSFIFLLGVIPSLFGNTVEEKLKYIPLDEKICMRKFFDFAIKLDQAVHVLYFDNKPMCLTGIVIKDTHRSFRDVLCLKGWRAFKKNEHLFEHPNFILHECLSGNNECRVLDIYIINKLALKKCLQQNICIFKECRGNGFTPEWFTAQLEENRTVVSK
jgi:hypothetical protein